MMIFRQRKILIGLVTILVILQGFDGTGRAQPAPEPVKLKVMVQPFLSFAPFYIAQVEGNFTQQGLQIEFVTIGRSSEAIPALTKGGLDVLVGITSAGLLNAIARGANIKFVADHGHLAPRNCGYYNLLARRTLIESGKLSNPTDLKGRRVSINPVSVEGYCIEKLLSSGGLSLEDIEIIDVPETVMSESFQKGTIDLAMTTEPWVTRISQAGHAVVWMPAQQVIPNFQYSFIVYGPNLLHKKSDAGRKFMIAYLNAVRKYNEGKTDKNLEIIIKHTRLDQELLKKTCWPALRNDGKINIESVLDFQTWAMKRGYLDKLVPTNQFWDPSFIEYANKVLGESKK